MSDELLCHNSIQECIATDSGFSNPIFRFNNAFLVFIMGNSAMQWNWLSEVRSLHTQTCPHTHSLHCCMLDKSQLHFTCMTKNDVVNCFVQRDLKTRVECIQTELKESTLIFPSDAQTAGLLHTLIDDCNYTYICRCVGHTHHTVIPVLGCYCKKRRTLPSRNVEPIYPVGELEWKSLHVGDRQEGKVDLHNRAMYVRGSSKCSPCVTIFYICMRFYSPKSNDNSWSTILDIMQPQMLNM